MKRYKTIFIVLIVLLLVFTTASYTQNMKPNEGICSCHRVVVYNTHPNKEMSSTLVSLKDLSLSLTTKLQREEIEGIFLHNNNTDMQHAYRESRKLVMNSIPDYKDSILIDIHLKNECLENEPDIVFYVGSSNKHFVKNYRFAQKISKLITDSTENISVKICTFDNATFNQDLSMKSLLLVLNNKDNSIESMNNVLDALVDSMKGSYIY